MIKIGLRSANYGTCVTQTLSLPFKDPIGIGGTQTSGSGMRNLYMFFLLNHINQTNFLNITYDVSYILFNRVQGRTSFTSIYTNIYI
jgi:hypothetical protein